MINRLKKAGFSDPGYCCILIAACVVFADIAFLNYTQALYEHFLPIACLLVPVILLGRKANTGSKRIFVLPALMAAWFLVVRLRYDADSASTYPIGLFFTACLFAFPLASLLRDGEEKKALKIFALSYLTAAGMLALDGMLLVLRRLPVFLREHVYWDGNRLWPFWHPNMAACFLMIGSVLCVTFMLRSKSRWVKLGLLGLLGMMLTAMALTNCRTAIVLTGVYLGATLFFGAIKRGMKWVLPAMLAVVILAIVFFAGAALLHRSNQALLLNGNAQLPSTSPQGTFFGDLGTLNSRTYIWRAALDAVRENPDVLIWGAGRPGAFVSEYAGLDLPHVHNAWLECFIGMGLAGLLLCVAFTLVTLWNCGVILICHHRDVWKRNVALLVLCLLAISVLEPYLFYTTPFNHPYNLIFFLCAGYLAHWQEADNRRILTKVRSKIPFLKS